MASTQSIREEDLVLLGVMGRLPVVIDETDSGVARDAVFVTVTGYAQDAEPLVLALR